MHTTNIYLDLLKDFSHEPTVKQDSALHIVSKFLLSHDYEELFLLKGYAGTGKTSIVGTLVKNCWKINKNCLNYENVPKRRIKSYFSGIIQTK